MPKPLISMIHSLPEGVVGHVLTFIPRNDTAQLIVNASQEDKLVLTYLRKYKVINDDYRERLYREIAPSVIGTSEYGGGDAPMSIIRQKVSVGERVRMRSISERCGNRWFNRSNL
jgi:hypothetical protein